MPILNSSKDFEYYLEKCTQAYEKKDLKECLYAALTCFELADKTEENFKKMAVLRMIKFSAEKLMEGLKPQTSDAEIKSNNEICSFCKKSEKNMQFICGVDVQICHECIEIAYKEAHKAQSK